MSTKLAPKPSEAAAADATAVETVAGAAAVVAVAETAGKRGIHSTNEVPFRRGPIHGPLGTCGHTRVHCRCLATHVNCVHPMRP